MKNAATLQLNKGGITGDAHGMKTLCSVAANDSVVCFIV